MTHPLRLAVTGVSGKMGRAILEAYAQYHVQSSSPLILTVALDRAESEWIGRDAGSLVGHHFDVPVSANTQDLANADVIIDFSRPEATMEYLTAAQAYKAALVIGTTGLSDDQKQKLQEASKTIPVLQSTNMGWGVNATFDILNYAAKVLGENYDVEIVEMHHKHKVDAPSGTALTMGEIIADAWDTTLQERAVYAREGITGARKSGTIGFSAVRGGDIIGEHTVIFAGNGERIEITHRATNRSMWAHGALQAASFLGTKPAKLYSMRDVTTLSRTT